MSDSKVQFTRVNCPQCRASYKVDARDADAFKAKLPAECPTCHPPVVAQVDVQPMVQTDKQVARLIEQVELLEAKLTALSQDVALILTVVTLPTPAPDSGK